jgi:hypothetical protein
VLGPRDRRTLRSPRGAHGSGFRVQQPSVRDCGSL